MNGGRRQQTIVGVFSGVQTGRGNRDARGLIGAGMAISKNRVRSFAPAFAAELMPDRPE